MQNIIVVCSNKLKINYSLLNKFLKATYAADDSFEIN